jgi:hypothetical protein
VGAAEALRFVDAALPLAVMGLYAQRGASSVVWEAGITLKNLAALAPARVASELAAVAAKGLSPDNVDAVHLAPNAMQAVSVAVGALLWPVPHLAPALPDLLEAALPGVDPNDAAKTSSALLLFSAVLAHVPLVDPADAAARGGGGGGDEDVVELAPWHPAAHNFTGVPPGALCSGALAAAPGGARRAALSGVGGRRGAAGVADVAQDGSRVTVAGGGGGGSSSSGGSGGEFAAEGGAAGMDTDDRGHGGGPHLEHDVRARARTFLFTPPQRRRLFGVSRSAHPHAANNPRPRPSPPRARCRCTCCSSLRATRARVCANGRSPFWSAPSA